MHILKSLGILLLTSITFLACNTGSPTFDTYYDHASQIPVDQALIDTYLSTHYYNEKDGNIWTIGSGSEATGAMPTDQQIALSADARLKTISGIVANDIDDTYTMYYFELEKGSNTTTGSPSTLDNVFVNYTGMLLDSTVFDSNIKYPIWLSLRSEVAGWSYGFQKFNGGDIVNLSDGDVEFVNYGKGFLIFPSGLGYKNIADSGIPENSPLVFKIELHNVYLTDDDFDSIFSKNEVTIDASGNTTLFDTDGDGFYDYIDRDDDGDGILTKNEPLNYLVKTK